jgi:arylsulfatase A-like enzyme
VASLITSTFPCEHGVLSERHKLNRNLKTLAERLDSIGYETLGRYANVWVGPISGLDRGYRNLQETPDQWSQMGARVDAMLGDIDTDRPFLLYVHTVEPHDPFKAPQGAIEKFGRVDMADQDAYYEAFNAFIKATGVDWTARREPGTTDQGAAISRAEQILRGLRDKISLMYDAAILTADRTFGSLVLKLIERDLLDRAIVIFVSDHGEEFNEHGGWFHQQSVYEELIRVPLMIRFPGGEFGGRRISTPVSLVDVMPTIFDYIGESQLCDGCRGDSLLPEVRGAASGDVDRARVLSLREDIRLHHPQWDATRGTVNVALRDGDWKGIWNAEQDRVELYDLASDPGELTDLSGQNPQRAAAFARQAAQWLDSCAARSPGAEAQTDLDAETEEKLRSLGYL